MPCLLRSLALRLGRERREELILSEFFFAFGYVRLLLLLD